MSRIGLITRSVPSALRIPPCRSRSTSTTRTTAPGRHRRARQPPPGLVGPGARAVARHPPPLRPRAFAARAASAALAGRSHGATKARNPNLGTVLNPNLSRVRRPQRRLDDRMRRQSHLSDQKFRLRPNKFGLRTVPKFRFRGEPATSSEAWQPCKRRGSGARSEGRRPERRWVARDRSRAGSH